VLNAVSEEGLSVMLAHLSAALAEPLSEMADEALMMADEPPDADSRFGCRRGATSGLWRGVGADRCGGLKWLSKMIWRPVKRLWSTRLCCVTGFLSWVVGPWP
jgi:hypothetical protein